MRKLKIRPRLSARQLRLAKRARHPAVFPATGFALGQSQKKLGIEGVSILDGSTPREDPGIIQLNFERTKKTLSPSISGELI